MSRSSDSNDMTVKTSANIAEPFMLQYVFFLDNEGMLLTCDDASSNFLKTINLELFHTQLQAIKINAAITNTTIILGNKSYNLRMVPNNFETQADDVNASSVNSTEYIIVLQDQTLFSYLFQKLNQMKPNQSHISQSELCDILNSSEGGIFITNSSGTVVFVNTAYESATGLNVSDVLGKNITDLGASGYFNPIVTPDILETRMSLTRLQRLATGKYAVISGSPIYDSNGDPKFIITCVSVIAMVMKTGPTKQIFNPADLKLDINKISSESFIDIIAESPIMKRILQDAIMIARYDVIVLLLGDSGVGKEVMASIIHSSGGRNKEKFVKVNCSAISPSLLESELFGYEAGAFTGALSKGKPGLFEIANNGTLLLDEIGDLSIELQAKLLRALQSREFYRIGGLEPIKTNARIIASTNKNLEGMVQRGEFREDLYYRLNVVAIEIPPLRDRRQDIKPLLSHFCYYYNNKYGTNKRFSEEALQILENYLWPGNIRELKNLVERLMVLCIEDLFLPEHLYNKYRFATPMPASDEDIQVNRVIPMKDAVRIVEKKLVTEAMNLYKSTRKTAEILEVSQSTVVRKLRESDPDCTDS